MQKPEHNKFTRVEFAANEGNFILQCLNNKTEFKVLGTDGKELKLNDRSQRQFLTRLFEYLISRGEMTNNEIGREILKNVNGKTEVDLKGFDLYI